jgi:hypothetical protein
MEQFYVTLVRRVTVWWRRKGLGIRQERGKNDEDELTQWIYDEMLFLHHIGS